MALVVAGLVGWWLGPCRHQAAGRAQQAATRFQSPDCCVHLLCAALQEEAAHAELARHALQQSLGSSGERQQAAAAAAVLHPDASSGASLGRRPSSGESLASRQAQAKGQQGQQQPAAPHHQQQQLPAYRPACINSARGAEYFNQAPSSSGGSNSAGSGGANNGSGQQFSGGSGGGSVPAHNRLYADHFRKQQRLEEERRLRWVLTLGGRLAGWLAGCW